MNASFTVKLRPSSDGGLEGLHRCVDIAGPQQRRRQPGIGIGIAVVELDRTPHFVQRAIVVGISDVDAAEQRMRACTSRIDRNGFLTEVLGALQRRFGIRRPTLQDAVELELVPIRHRRGHSRDRVR